MLKGERGEATALAMKLLTTVGDMYGAERTIKVESTHISGISYANIGDAGLEFIEDFAEMGAKSVIKATINPGAMDLKAWKELGLREDFAKKQIRIINAFQRMGIEPSCTCTPYFIGNRPRFGAHIAWSESSAIVFANSVLGARTNREGGPSALASAVTGITPLYGYHLDEKRRPTHRIEIKAEPKNELMFSALGYVVGEIVGDGVPLFEELGEPSEIELKALGASLATSGPVALCHIDGVTPESRFISAKDREACERVKVEYRDLLEVIERLSVEGEFDSICIGCPHCSLRELKSLAELLSGRKVRKRFWIFTSRNVRMKAEERGYVSAIEKSGARVIADTCMVVSPLEELGISGIITNSCKAAHYIPSTRRLPVKLLSSEESVKVAVR